MAICFDPSETRQIAQIQQRLAEFVFRGVHFNATFSAVTTMSDSSFTMLVQDMVDFLEEVEEE